MKLFCRKKKNKFLKMTLDDCVKYYRENQKYRYAVAVGKDRFPGSICETMESAKDDMNVHFVRGGQLPIEIVDLAFYEIEGKYAAKIL